MAPDFAQYMDGLLAKYSDKDRDRRRSAVVAELKRRQHEAHLTPDWQAIIRKAVEA